MSLYAPTLNVEYVAMIQVHSNLDLERTADLKEHKLILQFFLTAIAGQDSTMWSNMVGKEGVAPSSKARAQHTILWSPTPEEHLQDDTDAAAIQTLVRPGIRNC